MGDIKMNLFFLHKVAGKCAEDLCDKHIPKMVLETAQMLSTAHHYHNSVHKNSVYKRAYENHPTTKWVRQNCRTYEFAYRLFLDLLHEYFERFHKVHKCDTLRKFLAINPCPDGDWVEPPQCMPDEYKCDDTVTAYRNYYINEKAYFAKWTRSKIHKGKPPKWFITEEEQVYWC